MRFKGLCIKIASFVLAIAIVDVVPTYSFFQQNYIVANGKGDLTVIGDSYAGYFATYESNRDYNVSVFAEAGRTTRFNYEMMKAAIVLASNDILISIGVNDCFAKEPINAFKNRMEEFANIAKIMGKRIYVHTYMNYAGVAETTIDESEKEEQKFGLDSLAKMFGFTSEEKVSPLKETQEKILTPGDYDKALKEVSAKYDSFKYIDMSDYNTSAYLQPDLIHYNKTFYDALYDRISVAMILF